MQQPHLVPLSAQQQHLLPGLPIRLPQGQHLQLLSLSLSLSINVPPSPVGRLGCVAVPPLPAPAARYHQDPGPVVLARCAGAAPQEVQAGMMCVAVWDNPFFIVENVLGLNKLNFFPF